MVLSTRRLFAVVLLLSLFVVTSHEIVDPDYWWHLRTGQYILEHKSVPHTDPYSFTSNGKEWVAHEWLSEVLMYWVYSLAGHGGVVVLFSAIMAAAFGILYGRCQGKPFVAGFGVLLGAFAAAPTYGPRPQMLTFLLASIFLAVLESYSRDFDGRKLWPLVPLMLLWANLHAGFLLGLALIAVTGVGIALDGLGERGLGPALWRRVRPAILILTAATLAALINPNGLRLYSYPLETLRSPAMLAFIQEWQSPNFHTLSLTFLLVLLLVLTAAFALSQKRVGFRELLLLLISSYAALRSVRHVPIFVLITVPLLVDHFLSWTSGYRWSDWMRAPEKPTGRAKSILNTVFLLVVMVGGCLRLDRAVRDQQRNEGQRWPLAAVEFMRARRLPPPMFNNYNWGGYLIWKLYPDYQVYVDGRADVHGDALVEESVTTTAGQGHWKEPLERRAIHTVLIAPKSGLANLLREDRSWSKVYEDDQAVLFVKNPKA